MPTRILIAEDDDMMSRLYYKAFTLEGYLAELASDGNAALDKARELKPDFIILDVMMPKLNGLETLVRLKADPVLQAIPVVMLTNLAGQQDADAAIARGALKYIIKSEHEPHEVVAIIKQLLSAPPAAAVPPAPTTTSQPVTPSAGPASAPSLQSSPPSPADPGQSASAS